MASALIPDGDYYIVPANGSTNALDVSRSNFTNGANIQVWAILYNDAQIWHVTTRSNGTLQVASRFCGKCIDVLAANIKAGTNVQLFDDNDTIAQQWTPSKTGKTLTVGGVAYDTYRIACATDTTLAMSVATSSPGGNVSLGSGSGTGYEWAFVPVPKVRSGAVYELRPLVNTANALSIAASAKTNGSNVYVTPANGTNEQKFVLLQETTGYSLRNVYSGKFVDVDSAGAKDGQNVQIWDDNDTRAQRWKVSEYGTKTINGIDCQIIALGSYVTTDGDTYRMDVTAASTTTANVTIWTKNGTDAQKFVLYPTSATDPNMPVPYDVGITDAPDGQAKDFVTVTDSDFLTWKCSAAWCADGSNHYEVRYRSRTMSPTRSSWNAWEAWTPWTTAVVSKDKQQAWFGNGSNIVGDYTWTQAKNREVEIQVRSCGTDDLATLVSQYTDKVVNQYRKPAIVITDAGWTPGGLRIGWSSDYVNGTNYLNLSDITLNGKSVELQSKQVLTGNASTGSQTIPREALGEWLNDGDNIIVSYNPGYDQKTDLGIANADAVQVSYDAGTVSVEPVFGSIDKHLYASVVDLGNTRMWVNVGSSMVECIPVSREGGQVTFEVLYPMDGSTFHVYTEGTNDDGTKWGTDISDYAMKTVAHAFTVGDKTVYLGLFKDSLPSHQYSEKAIYSSYTLDNRPFESVAFANTHKGSWTVEGLIDSTCTETVDDFLALNGTHAVYRDVTGNIHNVAITGVNVTSNREYHEISIDMIKETI